MSNYCIKLNHVTKKFGNFTAVDDFTLQLEPGKIYGVVGPNGAGKSTTMGLIMGSIFPTEGDGTINNNPLASKQALKYLGYSPEFTSFYLDMSAIEYLWYMGTLAGLSSKEAMDKAGALLKQFNLTEHAYKKVSKFSTGMKKKVSLAQAMISDPQILLLDEPTANLDPTSRHEILEIVKSMVRDRNLTVLISSHVLTELQTVIDHVIMISGGHLVLNEEMSTAEKMFRQGVMLVDSSDNEKLAQLLTEFNPTVENDTLRVSSEDKVALKKSIVKAVYENDLTLNMLKEDTMTLDSVYQQVLGKGE